ncbi:RBBP9/YdeN family alpha/beta hydrolase [Actinomadura syzygii]|uniref:Alpha/beta hydrolase n=1 Tax=Actinomadura syzygii TaxID=1427538 RepID=A0A5D0TT83_9ACTN|nr:alpha/beta hydrolase [Actinomadura syzygii]TYC08515.1 alpha/beta hydrolase [Actinomadura syzygii]
MTILFVDGWLGPDPGDWQELWTRKLPGSRRVEQDDWHLAERNKWVARLDEAITACTEPPVLVAHSLGCPTVAHWVADNPHRRVRAALMVTPADVERNITPEITGFAPIPQIPFSFPTVVAASRNDHWMTPERAAAFAKSWNARLVDAGEVGHLTVTEGYGAWLQGEQLLTDLLNTTAG